MHQNVRTLQTKLMFMDKPKNSGIKTSFRLLLLGCGIMTLLIGCTAVNPPESEIVASFSGGTITLETLDKEIQRHLGPAVKSKMDVETDALKAQKKELLGQKKFYIELINEMAMRELIKIKVKEKKLDKAGNIRDSLKHVEEEITLDQFHESMHGPEGIPVTLEEIQRYYDTNSARYGSIPFSSAQEEIRSILVEGKEREFVVEYLRELMDAAAITRSYEIMRIPEPTEEDLVLAYQENRNDYMEPERWKLEGFTITADGKDSAEKRAKKASALLGAGESFESVASAYDITGAYATSEYIVGTDVENIETALRASAEGDPSAPVKTGDSFGIYRIRQKIPAGRLPFEAVREKVRSRLLELAEARILDQNRDMTLFSVHGKRFTLGEFYQEFSEMPRTEQARYRSFDQRVQLVDRMIERLVLLEDSYERMLNIQNSDDIDQEQQELLAGVLHQEEIDQKIEISDADIKDYFKKHKSRFKLPSENKIRVIVVRGDEDPEKALSKIQAAYGKLRGGWNKKAASFEEVAREYSEDSRSAANGGLIDEWIKESGDYMYETGVHLFHEAVQKLKEGEISKPVILGGDYYVLQIVERKDSRNLSFEEVREYIAQELQLGEHEKATAKMNEDLLKEAKLIVYQSVLRSVMDKYKGQVEL